MSLEQDVIDIVAEQLGVDKSEVTLNKSFVEDLNADSLDLTEMMMEIETHFDQEIPVDDASKLRTVGDVVEYIQKRRAEQGA